MATAIGAYATATLFKELAGITATDDDTLLGKVCDRTNQWIETQTKQVLAPITSATYLYDIRHDSRYVFLPTPPASEPAIGGIRAATLVELITETGGTFATVASTDYFLRSRAPGGGPYRYLVFSDQPAGSYTTWSKGYATVRVTGTAGWAAIPDDVTQMALAVVQRAWNARQSGYQNVDGVDENGRPVIARFFQLPDYATLKTYTLRREQVIA